MPGRRAASVPTQFPVEPISDTFGNFLIDSIDAFSTVNTRKMASTMAAVLLQLELVSKGIRHTIRQNVRLEFYRFFFHTSSKSNVPMRFLDATFGVSLFDGSFGLGPREPDRFNVVSPNEVVKDRVKTGARLMDLDVEQVVKRSANYQPNDLPSGVGPRVAAFVGRARFLTQFRASRRPEWVATCSLATCSCRLLTQDPNATQSNPAMNGLAPPTAESSSDEDDDDGLFDNYDEHEPPKPYWVNLSPRPITVLRSGCFCSMACHLAHESELAAAVPIRVADAETHESVGSVVGKTGLGRTLASTRAAYKRNDSSARALREAMRNFKKKATKTIRLETVERMHTDIVDVLNIDLGLLVAASELAASPTNCYNRDIPGTYEHWRNDAKKWRHAIELVKSIYIRYQKDTVIVRDERFPPAWLRKVKEKAAELFPVRCTV